ncbi:hypothetical protein A2U01_0059396, partial [Trifolium medium]|nr:hypothetical protein [Trifolium medium]
RGALGVPDAVLSEEHEGFPKETFCRLKWSGCVDEYSFSCPNGSVEELGPTSAGMVLELELSPIFL